MTILVDFPQDFNRKASKQAFGYTKSAGAAIRERSKDPDRGLTECRAFSVNGRQAGATGKTTHSQPEPFLSSADQEFLKFGPIVPFFLKRSCNKSEAFVR